MLRLRARQSAGDTLVEVLIAIGIVSLVLTTAYATVNRSVNVMHSTQEHSQALQTASSQVEFLRVHGGLDSTNNCFDSSGVPTQASGQACAFTADGANNCPTTNSYCFAVAITKTDSVPTYKVSVTWNSLSGGKDNIVLFYQVAAAVASDGDGDGSANIGDYCTANPSDCSGPSGDGSSDTTSGPPATTYAHYGFQDFISVLDAGSSPIVSCTWNWGDGTTNTYALGTTACQLGGYSDHDYPPIPGYPEGSECVNPDSIVPKIYTIVLYLNHQNGTQTISNSDEAWLPNCY